MRIIALHGYRSSGKDTSAEYLVSHLNETRGDGFAAQIAFVDPVVDLCQRLSCLPREYFTDTGKKDKVSFGMHGLTPREMLVSMSNHMKLVFGPLVVLNQVKESVRALKDRGFKVVVISDARLQSTEVPFIREYGSLLVLRRFGCSSANSSDYEAGIELRPDLGDIEVDNNGTIEDLYSRLRRAVRILKI